MNHNISQHSQSVAVTITSDQHDHRRRAVARLRWRGHTLVGFGLSHVEVDNVGEQLALAQAFSDLSRQLSCIS
jgi:Rv2632c-like